ncbi:MAG: single-stranded DNA-binding protein, partial [Oscillospiraceae bacterium]|nr:single-stranded DNA-binding protein [Oscillospiraceae bacterium]
NNNSNGYNNSNYDFQNQNNGNYYQPAPQNPVPQQPDNAPKDIQLGDSDISDFEEIISDGQVPF